MDKPIRVQVKEPCHENWQNMTENEKGRFCGSCQKTVVDFTLMSDRQILDHLSRATGGTCGRFANDQLDREMKAPVVKPKSRWAYFINLLIPIFFTSSCSENPKGKPTVISNSGNNADSKNSNDGIVGELSVIYCLSPGIIPDTAIATEVLGKVELEPDLDIIIPGPVVIKNEEVIPDTTPIVVTDTSRLMGDTILIKGNIEIPIPQLERCTVTLGGIGYSPVVVEKENAVINFMKDTLVSIGIKKPIKAYPNPVIAGQSITIDFSPKQLGTYKLDLFDLNGKTIYSRQVNMVYKKQSFQVPTISSWSKGTYIIRITGEGRDNVSNVKVILR